MCQNNRRKFDRLALRLEVLCRKVGQEKTTVLGRTVNISTGGVLCEIPPHELCHDDEVEFHFSVPPIEGISEISGKLRATGRILRITSNAAADSPTAHAIAAQFLQKPRFRV